MLRKNLLCKDKGICRPEEIKRRSRPSKERVEAAAKGTGWLPSISSPSCLSIRLSSCFESDLKWPRVKSVMVSLPFFTHLRMQNICQAVQPGDNYNEFIELEDFDHKTMKKGCQENHPEMGILLLLKRKELHTPREEGAVWSADRFGDRAG